MLPFCEGRALTVAKAVLPSRSPPGHAHKLHRLGATCGTTEANTLQPKLQSAHAGRFSRMGSDCGLFACTRSVNGKRPSGASLCASVLCRAFRAAKQPCAWPRRGCLRGSFGLRNCEMLPLRVFIFPKIYLPLL